ncbi:hypothetical protein V2T44_05015, partial [Serratia ficaria]|nr:hypothetical protein [Serratia ficaria]
NLRWSGQYDTFGKLQGQTVEGAARRNGAQYDQPLRYAGQYQDVESNLHYRYNSFDHGRTDVSADSFKSGYSAKKRLGGKC